MTAPLVTARAALRRSQAHALEERLQQINARLETIGRPEPGQHPGFSSDGDGDAGMAATNQEETAVIRERLTLEARALVAAIGRVRAGTYGVCASCSAVLPEKRLIAQPTAEMCVPCLTAREQVARRERRGRGWFPELEDVAPVELVDGDVIATPGETEAAW